MFFFPESESAAYSNNRLLWVHYIVRYFSLSSSLLSAMYNWGGFDFYLPLVEIPHKGKRNGADFV